MRLACSSEVCSSRSEEHTSELQSHDNVVCRLLVEKTRNLGRDGRAPAAYEVPLAGFPDGAPRPPHNDKLAPSPLQATPPRAPLLFFSTIRGPPSSTLFPNTAPSR